MAGSDDLSDSNSGRVIERGETYTHAEHGQVEVTGIWRGVDQVDQAHHADEKDTFVVRYSAEVNGEDVDGLPDTVDSFIELIE